MGDDGGEHGGEPCRSRASEQDALAVNRTAARRSAIAEGRFKEQILPIKLKNGEATTVFDTDEHVRATRRAEDLAKLRPVFDKDGTVTAGNASGINDARRGGRADGTRGGREARRDAAGAAGRLRARRRRSEVHGHRAGAGARRRCSGRVSRLADLDVIEANEAFAAQACAVAKIWSSIRRRPTRTAPAFRSAIRSARQARS